MPKEETGANAIFTGTSKVFSFIDNRIYAYTGGIDADNNETTLFESQTGKEYAVAKFQPVYFSTSSTDDATFILKFNGVNVFICTVESTTSSKPPFRFVDLLIPPLTLVTLTGYNRTDTSTISLGGIFTGKIY